MTVRENVQLALSSRGGSTTGSARMGALPGGEAAQALLERVGIGAFASRGCATLAYGDLKRVEFAIALAGSPRLLLMDEPTAGMAPAERQQLMAQVRTTAAAQALAILFTEHDMDVVFSCADRILVMDRGELIADGAPAAVRADPRVQEVYLGRGAVADASRA
jgi:branched-chain amino acid transport system ATP-binding protein